MTLYINYENEDFPAGTLSNLQLRLPVTWDDILWAAITVGRPDIIHVFRHQTASFHEAVFRWSMVRMALQQRGARAQKLVRTSLFKNMDPTEKGAVNYFLGLVICKLFAWKLLHAPWTIHLDVFRSTLAPRTLGGRSRPDMVAQDVKGDWHAFECKGRASAPGDREKQKAKAQAQRLVSVDNQNCVLHVGAITFFSNDAVNFYWRDPEPPAGDDISLQTTDFEWGEYYSPFMVAMRGAGRPVDVSYFEIEQLDLSISAHPKILGHLLEGDWQGARNLARELQEVFAAEGFKPDGLRVRAGPSWCEKLSPQ